MQAAARRLKEVFQYRCLHVIWWTMRRRCWSPLQLMLCEGPWRLWCASAGTRQRQQSPARAAASPQGTSSRPAVTQPTAHVLQLLLARLGLLPWLSPRQRAPSGARTLYPRTARTPAVRHWTQQAMPMMPWPGPHLSLSRWQPRDLQLYWTWRSCHHPAFTSQCLACRHGP